LLAFPQVLVYHKEHGAAKEWNPLEEGVLMEMIVEPSHHAVLVVFRETRGDVLFDLLEQVLPVRVPGLKVATFIRYKEVGNRLVVLHAVLFETLVEDIEQ
jgi:hypothetical protein